MAKEPPRQNYARRTEEIMKEARASGAVPRLLLHSCCAPCSSAVMEYLRDTFALTVFYYNPNITDSREYEFRKAEELRLIRACNEQDARPIEVLEAPYEPERFLSEVRGLESEKEGGARCSVCFALRLNKTAEAAAAGGYDFFTTTLTISPLKDAERLNRIGEAAGKRFGVRFLPSDFKKKDGYKRSIELSKQYGLYRQNYCGCEFSRQEAAGREAGRTGQGTETGEKGPVT